MAEYLKLNFSIVSSWKFRKLCNEYPDEYKYPRTITIIGFKTNPINSSRSSTKSAGDNSPFT